MVILLFFVTGSPEDFIDWSVMFQQLKNYLLEGKILCYLNASDTEQLEHHLNKLDFSE